MELTEQEVQEKENELIKVEEDLRVAIQQQQEAAAFGDFSENSERDMAIAKSIELERKKQTLLEQLSDYTLIKPNRGPRIQLGDTIEFFAVNDDNKQVTKARTMRLAAEGDTYSKNTLGIDSPLGQAIINGTSGIYTIQTPSGVLRYDVKKKI